MKWPGREMAFLKGNLPTVSRVHGFPCPASSSATSAGHFGNLVQEKTRGYCVRPAILTPFAGASRFPRPSLNGGATRTRDRYHKSCSDHPINRQPSGLAVPRHCLTGGTKKKVPNYGKRLPRGGMPTVRNLQCQTGNHESLGWALTLDRNLRVQPSLFNPPQYLGERGWLRLEQKMATKTARSYCPFRRCL